MRTRFAACLAVLAIAGAAPLPAAARGEGPSADFNPVLAGPVLAAPAPAAPARQAPADRAYCARRHATAPAELRGQACQAGNEAVAHRC